jgi:indolepyruvate ferredoxin oxidoreductase beta subunit
VRKVKVIPVVDTADTKNILIVGVGGQGTILASRVIAGVVMRRGLDIKVSEIHGMAQRGGSVVTQVRFGKEVFAPTITPGTADFILAFEKLEALRWLHYLREGGTVIVNSQELYPLPVLTGSKEYPVDTMERIRGKVSRAIEIDALEIAKKCGSPKVVNTVLLGVLAGLLDSDLEAWRETIRETVPPRTVDINLAAFEEGIDRGKEFLSQVGN